MLRKKFNFVILNLFLLLILLISISECVMPDISNSKKEKDKEVFLLPQSTDTPLPLGTVGQISTQKPTFSWIKAIDSDRYRLVVSDSPDIESGTLLIDVTLNDTKFASPVTFEKGKSYWWKVKAFKGSIPGKWSDITSFTVITEDIINDPVETSEKLPAPYPVSPEGTIVDAMPAFSWTEIMGADHYEFYIIKSDESIELGPITTNENSFKPASPISADINLRWKVKAVENNGESGYFSDSQKSMYFIIKTLPPQPVSKPFPLEPLGQITTRKPTFKWIEALDSDNYWLIVSDIKDIGSGVRLIDTIVWGTSYTSPINFENGKTYWWKVKSKKGDVPGNWSEIVSFTVNTGEPAPVLSTPFPLSPEGYISDLTPVFKWNAVAGADHYVLYVVRPDDSIELGPINVKETSLTPVTPLSPDIRLRWKVKAVDAYNNSGLYSDTMKTMYFTITADRLPAPVPYSPEGEIYNSMPRFEWSKVDGAVSYALFVIKANDELALGPIYTNDNYYQTVTPLPINENMRWKVKAFDEYDSSGYYSDSIKQMYFIISDSSNRLPAPVPYSPEGLISETKPTFSWSAVSGADHYVLYLIRPDDTIELGPIDTAGTNFTPAADISKNINIRWKVKAVDNNNVSGLYSDSIKQMFFTINDGSQQTADFDNDDIDDSFEEQLIRRAAPVFKLHPDDVYRPSTVEWYLTNVKMYYRAPNISYWPIYEIGEINKENITTRWVRESNNNTYYSDEKTFRSNFHLDIVSDVIRKGDWSKNWTCYAHVKKVPGDNIYYDVQYWVFYPYNGVLSSRAHSEHEGDWEHITVRLFGTPNGKISILAVLYARHGVSEWKWYYTHEIQFYNGNYETGRPIVYSAKHSHGAYTNAGRQSRGGFFDPFVPDDHTADGGIVWDTLNSVVNVGERADLGATMLGFNWLNYSGRWGEYRYSPINPHVNGPHGPAFKDEWLDEPVLPPWSDPPPEEEEE